MPLYFLCLRGCETWWFKTSSCVHKRARGKPALPPSPSSPSDLSLLRVKHGAGVSRVRYEGHVLVAFNQTLGFNLVCAVSSPMKTMGHISLVENRVQSVSLQDCGRTLGIVAVSPEFKQWSRVLVMRSTITVQIAVGVLARTYGL